MDLRGMNTIMTGKFRYRSFTPDGFKGDTGLKGGFVILRFDIVDLLLVEDQTTQIYSLTHCPYIGDHLTKIYVYFRKVRD